MSFTLSRLAGSAAFSATCRYIKVAPCCSRIVSCTVVPSSSNYLPSSGNYLPSSSNYYSPPLRFIQTAPASEEEPLGYKESLGYKIGLYTGQKRAQWRRYLHRAFIVKNICESVYKIDYVELFAVCRLPDTFPSWFSVIALHMYMVLVRLKHEGNEGQTLTHDVVTIMWKDVATRLKLLNVYNIKQKNKITQDFGTRFLGLIVALDEGIYGSDVVLASAIWRNLFNSAKEAEIEDVGLMVNYVRKQIQHLESQDSMTLLSFGEIDWLPLRDTL